MGRWFSKSAKTKGAALSAADTEAEHSERHHRAGNLWLLALGFVALATVVLVEHLSDGAPSKVFSLYTAMSLGKEVGFALLIAWGVSAGIEKQARARDLENAEKTRGRIAQDVVHALYGLQHNNNYVRKVIERTLQPHVVRDRFECDYTLCPLSADEIASLGVDPTRFVKLTLLSRYTFMNVSTQAIEFDVRYALAARFGKALRDFATIKQVKIDGARLSEAEILAAQQTTEADAYKGYKWTRSIPGGGRLSVMIEAVSIKELSDNEIWGNYHATYRGMQLTVHVRVPGLKYGIRDLTSTKATQIYESETGDACWTIDGPILPNESVTLWWRTPEDDGGSLAEPQLPKVV